MDLPPLRVDIIRRPLRLPPGELWCTHCGADVSAGLYPEMTGKGCCPICEQPAALVPAVQVLQPDEYFVAH